MPRAWRAESRWTKRPGASRAVYIIAGDHVSTFRSINLDHFTAYGIEDLAVTCCKIDSIGCLKLLLKTNRCTIDRWLLMYAEATSSYKCLEYLKTFIEKDYTDRDIELVREQLYHINNDLENKCLFLYKKLFDAF